MTDADWSTVAMFTIFAQTGIMLVLSIRISRLLQQVRRLKAAQSPTNIPSTPEPHHHRDKVALR